MDSHRRHNTRLLTYWKCCVNNTVQTSLLWKNLTSKLSKYVCFVRLSRWNCCVFLSPPPPRIFVGFKLQSLFGALSLQLAFLSCPPPPHIFVGLIAKPDLIAVSFFSTTIPLPLSLSPSLSFASRHFFGGLCSRDWLASTLVILRHHFYISYYVTTN